MGLIIHGGNSNDPVYEKDNRLLTDSISVGPLEHASEEGGNAAFFASSYAATGGQEVISIQNDEPTDLLHITRLFLASTIQTVWTLFEVTSGTPAGTVLTYQNPNLESGTDRSVTAFGNASVTGSLSGNTLGIFSSLADAQIELFLEGSLILGKNDKIALTADATGTLYVTVIGFWDTP